MENGRKIFVDGIAEFLSTIARKSAIFGQNVIETYCGHEYLCMPFKSMVADGGYRLLAIGTNDNGVSIFFDKMFVVAMDMDERICFLWAESSKIEPLTDSEIKSAGLDGDF